MGVIWGLCRVYMGIIEGLYEDYIVIVTIQVGES